MLVSAVIPNYNGKTYLKVCLDSLSRQTYNAFEIIIIDNDSTDGSCEFVNENYPNVKVIMLDQNYGFSRAVNEGIKISKGEYVILLNNDTEVAEEWLLNLVNCIKQDNNIFSCCSKMIRYSDRDIIDDAGDELNILGWAYKLGDGSKVDKYNKDYSVFSSCAGAAIYRKSILEEIGYFDENFFAYLEDVDISYRAKIHGYKNIFCSNALVYHIGSATSGSKYNKFKIKLAARNNIFLLIKNMPLLQLLINMPFLLLGFQIKLIFFFLKGFGKEYLHGIGEGMENMIKIRRVKYNNRFLINYFIIEFELICNLFKYMFIKCKKIVSV